MQRIRASGQPRCLPPHRVQTGSRSLRRISRPSLTDRLSLSPLPINLAILGLGEDGHIASIFPGHPINSASNSLCEVATPPIAPSIRISLAFSLLASSHHIIIVVTGQNKRRRLEQFIDSQDPQIPFMRLVQETHSPITIFESN